MRVGIPLPFLEEMGRLFQSELVDVKESRGGEGGSRKKGEEGERKGKEGEGSERGEEGGEGKQTK